jgi:hypothetical protein
MLRSISGLPHSEPIRRAANGGANAFAYLCDVQTNAATDDRVP